MRVYELAKETGLTSAELLQAAESAGVEVASAISVIDAADEGKLRTAAKSWVPTN